MKLHLVEGDIIDQRKILRRLSELQYTRNDLELRRGTFQVKGEIIDIFPADSEKEALRIELFDKEIENLYLFDPLTGQIIKKLKRFTVFPKTHYVHFQSLDQILLYLKIDCSHFQNLKCQNY